MPRAVVRLRVNTRSRSSKRDIPVDLPAHLGEPLVVRRHGWRRRIERPDGSELPVDPWGNRRTEGADGSRVRIEPAVGYRAFGHAVRISGKLVELEDPLDPREQRWIYAAIALAWVAGVLLEAHSLLAVGMAVVVIAGWIAARQLRRRDDPHRRTRAAVTMVVALGAAIALHALLARLW